MCVCARVCRCMRVRACTYRFLEDFFFFFPSEETSQLQVDPELSCGERNQITHCIIQLALCTPEAPPGS